MKAISKVMYAEDSMPYQCVEFTDDEIKRMVPLKDLPPGTILPKFRPLPFPANPMNDEDKKFTEEINNMIEDSIVEIMKETGRTREQAEKDWLERVRQMIESRGRK